MYILYIYIVYIYIIYITYTHIYRYIYLLANAIVRVPNSRRGDNQGGGTFLARSADNQTRNYDTECSNYRPSLSTLRPKRLSRRKMECWVIYTDLPVNAIVTLPHPQSGDEGMRKEIFWIRTRSSTSVCQFWQGKRCFLFKFNIYLIV